MKLLSLLFAGLIVPLGWVIPNVSDAAVIVISNRTDEALKFEILTQDEESTSYRLVPNQSEPIPVTRAVKLRTTGQGSETFELRPNAIYFFGRGPDGLVFEEIGFSAPALPQEQNSDSGSAPGRVDLPAMGSVKVKILIDDELYRRQDPERRLRKRVLAASAVFEQAAHIRFDVISVEPWESIDRVTDFEAILIDFERKVEVELGELAIGFSTQASRSKKKMGGTRLPLHSHVLVRERGQRLLSERAQLELLVHELGHYLGAVHSPEGGSAMRPVLGDGLADSPGFQIGLDPVNTMIVYLVGEELRGRKIRGIWDLGPEVKSQLRQIYGDLAKSLPDDPAAEAYRKALDLKESPPTTPRVLTPLAKHIRQVVKAVTLAAERNVKLPDKRIAERFGKPYRLSGDELTEAYIREAARVAQEIPAEERPRAFAIGLAVAMDTSTLLRDNPLTRITWRSIETNREYQFRKAVLGQPTMRGRYDLTQHFCISAGLAALHGPYVAEKAGIWKELTDGTFSRGDYSADLAGISLFEHMKASPDLLGSIAMEFRITDYVPLCLEADPKLLQPDHSNPSSKDGRMRAEIIEEIGDLPGYAADRGDHTIKQ